MELQRDTVLRKIHNCTPEAIAFLDEWYNESEYVIAHTSGSTGAPRPIKLLKNDMRISAMSTNRYFNITQSSKLLCPLSANYIAGKMMIVRAIIVGAELWMEHPSNTPVFNDYGNIDLIAVVPSQVQHLLSNSLIVNNIRNVLIGGAQLPSKLIKQIVRSGMTAYVSYGMTETCSHVALRKVDSTYSEQYEAMHDINFEIDNRGCLVICSKSRSFRELFTNDIVEIIDNRHFVWKGRIDNVINSGGIKVYPEEIEQLIQHVIPDGIEFYISKTTDEKWGEVPVLVISKAVINVLQLLKDARKCVKMNAQRPVKILVRPIEHTSSGKIIRKPSCE